MTYPNLTNEEIQKLTDAIGNTLSNIKSDIRKAKLKVFGKTLLLLVIVRKSKRKTKRKREAKKKLKI